MGSKEKLPNFGVEGYISLHIKFLSDIRGFKEITWISHCEINSLVWGRITKFTVRTQFYEDRVSKIPVSLIFQILI